MRNVFKIASLIGWIFAIFYYGIWNVVFVLIIIATSALAFSLIGNKSS